MIGVACANNRIVRYLVCVAEDSGGSNLVLEITYDRPGKELA